MTGPVISFDVSKGSSHFQAFSAPGMKLSAVLEAKHNLDELKKVDELVKEVVAKTGKAPVMVYETTGIYSNPLQRYFSQKGYVAYALCPLEFARERKSGIRGTKTDSIDCKTIANAFYKKDEAISVSKTAKAYDSLYVLSRSYRFQLRKMTAEKNRFHRCLDNVWAGFDDVYAYDSDVMLDIVIKFGHPGKIKRIDFVLSTIKDDMTSRVSKEKVAKKFLDFSKICMSGVDEDSYAVSEAIAMAKRLKESMKETKDILGQMLSVAKGLKEFELLKTLPNVGDISALRLISEIRDISRFKTRKALVAYCGLDPAIYQSGKMTGEHMSITKKGNSFLRSTLYLCVQNMVKFSKDSRVAKYVLKKKSSGMCYKAAAIAGCNKLLRIIYGMLTNHKKYLEASK